MKARVIVLLIKEAEKKSWRKVEKFTNTLGKVEQLKGWGKVHEI